MKLETKIRMTIEAYLRILDLQRLLEIEKIAQKMANEVRRGLGMEEMADDETNKA